MGYKFIYTKDPDNVYDDTNVTMEVDSVTLIDLIEAFERFVWATGFNLEGREIALVESEDE